MLSIPEQIKHHLLPTLAIIKQLTDHFNIIIYHNLVLSLADKLEKVT